MNLRLEAMRRRLGFAVKEQQVALLPITMAKTAVCDRFF